jgi:hypothetical protein
VKVRILAALLAVIAGAGCAGSSATPSADPSRTVHFTCPTHAKLGVYNNNRLHVLKECQWFRGTVTQVENRSDGDLHILVRPDAGFTHFLNEGNYNSENGDLVIEIMPGQRLPAPTVGEHLAVFGSWVLDQNNGWNEIHPVWGLRYLDSQTAAFSLPPVVPLYNGGSNS